MDNFIFFSMNATNLAALNNNYRSSKLLIQQPTYKEITKELPKNANIFMYYDLSSTRPDFLEGNNILSKLLSLYEKGVASIYFTGSELRLNISSAGVNGNKTLPFPGFPQTLKNGTSSPVLCQDIRDSKLPELIYLDANHQLIIQELSKDELQESTPGAPVEENSEIYVSRNRSSGNYEIFVYAKSGTVYKFNVYGQPVNPFPLITNFKNSFAPTEIADKLLFYQKTDKFLYLVDKTTGEETKIDFELPNPILATPDHLADYLAFHPKNFTGTVFLTDLRGKPYTGWPQDGGGVSYCSPLLYKNSSQMLRIAFLTQAGIMNVWNEGGKQVDSFPVRLNGIYYINPVLFAYARHQPKGLLTLSEQGYISLISDKGNIVKEKQLNGINGKQAGLTVFDLDRDGEEEIFIYGTSNFITGLDSKLEMLPGFPVKGSYRPAFIDLNFDGKYELVTASYDNNLYAYTLSK
jgi:hypothetical protein